MSSICIFNTYTYPTHLHILNLCTHPVQTLSLGYAIHIRIYPGESYENRIHF